MRFSPPKIFLPALLFLLSCSVSPHVTNTSETHYILSETPADSSMQAMILPYKQQFDLAMNEVIAESTEAFVKKEGESTLGNWASDACMQAGKKWLGKDSVRLQAVVFNTGGLRNPLPKGKITVGNIYEVMPFDNELIILEIKGDEMEQLLNMMAAKKGFPESGIRMQIVRNRPEAVTIQGKAFDKTTTYYVLTSDFLANGGDNYVFFKNPLQSIALHTKLRDVLLDYCRQQTARGLRLMPLLDGRIQLAE